VAHRLWLIVVARIAPFRWQFIILDLARPGTFFCLFAHAMCLRISLKKDIQKSPVGLNQSSRPSL
jgi:hypothetical protein